MKFLYHAAYRTLQIELASAATDETHIEETQQLPPGEIQTSGFQARG